MILGGPSTGVVGPPQGVVSGEFADQRRPLATGNRLISLTAPMMLNYFPAGANLASTGEVILWGYVCDPMSLREKATKMAFSIEEAPCRSTGFFTAPYKGHSRNGCDSEETTPLRLPNDVRWQRQKAPLRCEEKSS